MSTLKTIILKAREKYLEAAENFKLYQNKIRQAQGLATVSDNLALIALKNGDLNEAKAYFSNSFHCVRTQ